MNKEELKKIKEIFRDSLESSCKFEPCVGNGIGCLDCGLKRLDSLYSSQEPQKLIPKPRFDEVYKQCVENMDKSEPQPYCITEINRDGSITYKRIQPQSVVTPTEGMELTQEQINIELFNYAYQIVTSNPIKDWNYNELIKQISKAQVAKVLKNLPTEQEIIEKTLREIDTKCAHVGLVGSGRENRIISADLWLKLSRQS